MCFVPHAKVELIPNLIEPDINFNTTGLIYFCSIQIAQNLI